VKAVNKKLHKTLGRVIGFFLIFVFAFSALSMIFSVVVFGVLFQRVDSLDNYVEITYALSGSGYRREKIGFGSGGNTLSGYLYPAEDPKGLVIIVPGMNSNSDSHLAEIMFFADNGYMSLCYDATGVCESGGDSTVGLQQSKRDLLAAIDYVKHRSEISNLPVYLYGHSLGGYAAAAVLDEADVKAAVCLSGFDSPVKTMHGKAKEYVGLLADIQYPFLYLQNIFVFGGDADDTAVESINSVSTPVLICHGDNDSTIPQSLSLYSREDDITNVNAEFYEVDKEYRDGHTYMWLSEKSAKYMAELQNELNDLSAANGGKIPKAVLDDFYSGVDVKKAMELDENFMNRVLGFMR
jgi:alpha-beta hydrolase superfamily lysophospholipase